MTGLRTFSAMLLAAAFAAMSATPAMADLLDDPLHGYPGNDNGINTPVSSSGFNQPTNFGFTVSPGPASGDLLVDILVPNNLSPLPASFGMTGTFSGTATKFSPTAWTSGFLDTFLGISASPSNGIGAFLPSTQALVSGVTGFFVYQLDAGTQTLQDASNPNVSPLENLTSTLSLGSYIVAFLNEGTAGAPNWVATANSGAIFQDAAPVPEPSTFAVAGLGALAFVGYGLRKRFKK
jgi:hypothetical protein